MRLVAATRSGIALADASSVREVLRADVRCLAARDGRIVAGTQTDGLHRSDDGGTTWRPAGLPGMTVKSVAAAEDDVLAAGTQPPAVFVSRDGGQTWRESATFRSMRRWWWWQPADVPHTPYVSALAVEGETILAGLEFGRVLRSGDGGRTWTRLRGVALDCHALALRGDDAYEGAGFGPARSVDGGRTWTRSRAGLDRRYVMTIAVDPSDPTCWYVAAAPLRRAHGPDAHAVVFRWEGARWRALTPELAELPHALVCPGPDRVVAGLRDGTILSSGDRGETWTSLPYRLDGLRALAVV